MDPKTMKPYFAYGSNMADGQMAKRCPDARKLGAARLAGYRWIISTRGYANVVESPGAEVEGVLFEISASDERALDRYEAVASGLYGKAMLPVLFEAREVLALVYVSPETEEGVPKREYIRRINEGLADARLSDAYVSSQVRKFISARP
jgi:gamma-glutamylcyclotransferase (GGCT)/AIG2-like uncharacterized protein YtfP